MTKNASASPLEAETTEAALRDLVARYSDAVNRRDAKSWSRTWALDSEWVLGGQVTRGREAIVKRWIDLLEQVPFVLQLPTFGLFDFTTPTPRGRWYLHEISQRPARSSTMIGVYHDVYILEDGRWHFRRRRFDVLYKSPQELAGVWTPFPTDAANDAGD